MGSTSVADIVATTLAAAGARYAFGHPGGEVVVLIDALRRQGIPFVLTRHEATAAFMAGAQGELTGIPGVCVGTLGPGATNLVTGVASALLERAPMVALTGALARGAPSGTTHQALRLNALFEPITKESCELSVEGVAADAAAAVALAAAPRPGPVHLSLPSDIAPMDAAQSAEYATGDGGEAPSDAAQPDIRQAADLIRRSSRPVVIVGLDAVHANAAKAIRVLARRLGAPVATTPKAKGLYPEDDPGFAGVLEMAGDDLVIDSLKDADLVLAVGLDVVEFDKPWRLAAPVVHVSHIPNAENYYPAEIELVGSIPETLARLSDEEVDREPWAAERLAEHRAGLSDFIRMDGGALQAWQVVDAVRAAMPRSAIATSDVGIHKMLVGQIWTAYEPREFFQANGLSSMGYSIPTASAVRLLRPEQDVVAFVGDGGLGMYLGELETLVRIGIDLLVVVLVDNSLEMIRRVQLRREVPTDGTSILNPDFDALGRAFGIAATEVDNAEELARAVRELVPATGIRILAAHIDKQGYRL